MIIDVNACVGHYPFRQLRGNTIEAMIGLMDSNGIDRAVVSSLHAVFYRDAHRGNAELNEETKRHRSRFIPVATVNPKYVGWERDMSEAVERWKMRVISLVPDYHGYALNDDHGRAALARIAELGVPVLLMQRFEDRRQRHHWDRAEEMPVAALLDAARAHPTLKFLLVNWLGLDGAGLLEAGLKGRCLIDFARAAMVYRREALRLMDTIGFESLAFGSHMPFDYVGPSLVKLASLQKLRPADYEAIAWRNAAKFLGL